MPGRKIRSSYVLCVRNPGYQASLEVRKVYRRLPDTEGGKRGYSRVIDESGEDYLYPDAFFVDIQVPGPARRVFASAG